MAKIYGAKDFSVMPWKNGQGSTTQLFIEPRSARFPTDPFVWRLSSAPIREDGAFSCFKNYSRILTLIEGSGVYLNDHLLNFGDVYGFRGDDEISARLKNGPVKDLGLIYDPTQVAAEMNFVTNKSLAGVDLDLETNEIVLVYVISGRMRIDGSKVEEKELACIHDAGRARIDIERSGLWTEIRIKEL